MPNYDYRHLEPSRSEDKICQLGEVFTEFQAMSAEAHTQCPTCGNPVLRIIGAGAGIIFKGTGFFCTDYRRPEQPAKGKDK
jgi:putative FmdB family regulatory protein